MRLVLGPPEPQVGPLWPQGNGIPLTKFPLRHQQTASAQPLLKPRWLSPTHGAASEYRNRSLSGSNALTRPVDGGAARRHVAPDGTQSPT